ncbi:MAG: AraC family transcriptional regulator [Cyanobacteria bacterium P01_H01_bin.26]
MAERLSLGRWDEWYDTGSWQDPRLLHADPCDRVLVCPHHLGNGYYQQICLDDDITLVILDYELHHDLVLYISEDYNGIEFEFQLAGPRTGHSFLEFYFGMPAMVIKRARRQYFKVEVFFGPSALSNYFQAILERFTSKNQKLANSFLKALYRSCGGGHNPSQTTLLKRIFAANKTYNNAMFEHLIPKQLFNEIINISYAARSPITTAMQTLIGQILGCPYSGSARRCYLKQKVIELVDLRLDAITHPRLPFDELNHVYQAATMLRENLTNPPTVETLARQIGTNRLKINQGFHQVYGTTPYRYLRDYRLIQAKQLLLTSELSIDQVATAVGYSSRSRFATAFRKYIGINPKTFQMQTWHRAS